MTRINLSNRNRKKGYTLLELMVVLAIIGIILSISVPNTSLFKKIKEKQEINGLKKDLIYARNRAITERKIYDVRFNLTNNSYQIRSNFTEPIFISKNFSSGIRFGDDSIKSLRFNPTGRPANAGTIILFSCDKSVYRITISPVTGRVEVIHD